MSTSAVLLSVDCITTPSYIQTFSLKDIETVLDHLESSIDLLIKRRKQLVRISNRKSNGYDEGNSLYSSSSPSSSPTSSSSSSSPSSSPHSSSSPSSSSPLSSPPNKSFKSKADKEGIDDTQEHINYLLSMYTEKGNRIGVQKLHTMISVLSGGEITPKNAQKYLKHLPKRKIGKYPCYIGIRAVGPFLEAHRDKKSIMRAYHKYNSSN